MIGFTAIPFNIEFVTAFMGIIFVNIILSGDNALVIAMAVKSLPVSERRKGIIYGTAMAVVLRIILTFCAAKLLDVPLMKFFGGTLVLWIAVKLLTDAGAEKEREENGSTNIRKAIITILVADIVMSIDNVIAVAGASKGSIFLLVTGLGTSIPVVIFASNIISKLLARFHVILFIGAAVLGSVAGEMIIADPIVQRLLHHPGHAAEYIAQGFFAVGVVMAGRVLMKRKEIKALHKAPMAAVVGESNPFCVAGWDIQ